jgi:hypothetical protein
MKLKTQFYFHILFFVLSVSGFIYTIYRINTATTAEEFIANVLGMSIFVCSSCFNVFNALDIKEKINKDKK